MTQELVLLGAGAAHLEFLSRWAKRPVPGVRITLIARAGRYFEPALLPYAVAGDHDVSRLVIDIEPMAQRAKAVWPDAQVQALDANANAILLDDGRELRYDWLSVDQEPAQMRARADIAMPGARKNGLFVRPLEAFATLWPKVVGMAQTKPVRVAVIADQLAGLPALELAFAVRDRLPGRFGDSDYRRRATGAGAGRAPAPAPGQPAAGPTQATPTRSAMPALWHLMRCMRARGRRCSQGT